MVDNVHIDDPTGLRSSYIESDWLGDDETIKKVRKVRLTLLDNHLKDGIPTDSDGFEQLHKNLQELDKSAFKSKQLKQEEKSSEAQGRLAMEIANQLAQSLGSRDIFVGKNENEATIPNPEHILGQSVPVPGELKIGDDGTSYEVFNNTVGKSLDEARRNAKAETTE